MKITMRNPELPHQIIPMSVGHDLAVSCNCLASTAGGRPGYDPIECRAGVFTAAEMWAAWHAWHLMRDAAADPGRDPVQVGKVIAELAARLQSGGGLA